MGDLILRYLPSARSYVTKNEVRSVGFFCPPFLPTETKENSGRYVKSIQVHSCTSWMPRLACVLMSSEENDQQAAGDSFNLSETSDAPTVINSESFQSPASALSSPTASVASTSTSAVLEPTQSGARLPKKKVGSRLVGKVGRKSAQVASLRLASSAKAAKPSPFQSKTTELLTSH